ncbi:hypothetical protein ECANGB1_1189 [Enterospora canceri]|uniref:Uncharacterized protein n=1 Tax=Enterospora canceri TaxID=1081671 RepID=A0A1Y1S417_9MICR|nr:hypothetical protein ECANGB1_1189 [Enterospora canceri]
MGYVDVMGYAVEAELVEMEYDDVMVEYVTELVVTEYEAEYVIVTVMEYDAVTVEYMVAVVAVMADYVMAVCVMAAELVLLNYAFSISLFLTSFCLHLLTVLDLVGIQVDVEHCDELEHCEMLEHCDELDCKVALVAIHPLLQIPCFLLV